MTLPLFIIYDSDHMKAKQAQQEVLFKLGLFSPNLHQVEWIIHFECILLLSFKIWFGPEWLDLCNAFKDCLLFYLCRMESI